MKSTAQVVVIGGGVVGCSVLYHLTKKGWKDVMLLERDQLTSGSTWHAAGGFHTLNGDPNVAMLQSYTVGLYKELEAISGQSCGMHLSAGIMLADTPERLEFLKTTVAKGRYLGMATEIISVTEAKKYFPFIEEQHFIGALLDPNEGHLDPSGTTYAYAKAARLGGATIEIQTKVEALEQKPDGHWRVITSKGVIECEHVVNAGGLWAREVGRMVGIELPVLAMEHMYLVTDEIPEVVAFNQQSGKEIGHVIDFGAECYLRQEGKGIVLGAYEKACVPWSPKETPWSFGQELLQP
ncbi:MAG: FAD-binding oxidoreductase, partial [Rhodoferax sp.]|nr:FAD-binding oxidoreductase [Rhodoferax sp.]